MPYIDSISQAATASERGAAAATSTKDVLGKEDFLTLLVAQLQNQDPLNPDDPTEFTAQLAQFSSLEQLFNLNDSMDNLVQSNANSDRLSMLNTIGKEVAYQGSKFTYSGDPVTVGYQLDGQATEVKLALQHNGVTVATLSGTELGQGSHYITWDGLTSDGNPAPTGDYKIIVSAKAAEGESVAAGPLVRAEVTGVDLDGEYGGTLVTTSGEVAFTAILGVFDKNSAAYNNGTEEGSSAEEASTTDTATETAADTAVSDTTTAEADVTG